MSNSYLFSQFLLTFIDNFKEHREDLSAVLLTHQKYLWLGSDETSTIEQLSLVDTDKFTEHQQFRVAEFISLPALEEEEIDIEGLAYTDYYLWFVGSHSYKRKKPKSEKTGVQNFKRLAKIESEPNRYLLGRIPMIDGEGMMLFEDIAGIPSLLVVYDSPAKTRLVGDSGVIADVFKLG